MHSSEHQLIQRILRGEEGAFEVLTSQWQQPIYYHCLSIVKDEEIAQDLTQETFLHAFQHLGSFQEKSKLSTWLWKIAHNLSLNYVKKKRVLEEEFQESYHQAPQENAESSGEEIEEALKELSPIHRQVFELYEMEGVPQKEIAARLNIPVGTVRSRLYYARRHLRQYFQK